MVDAIGANSSPACGGAASTSRLAQTEEQLFANIDTNGDGSISQSELTRFMSQLSAAGSASLPVNSSSLYSALDTSGGSGISLQDFQSNIGTFVDALRSQLAAAQAGTAGSATAAATRAGASSASGTSAAATDATAMTRHHGHHGHRGGAAALMASLLQQVPADGTAAAGGAQPTLDTTA